ncbi:eukaryotic peptide chain release factor subunit 1 [Trypanosoma rangeli]|uniref:Protein pelota homolog n=1 Tax=Trypanosoma rangeli TaxID=5698 RepID=A0A3R7NPE6_TRYRA|nr:eukaryotic peptide chain release factor subunit 1 [Trypanosoma rangeli]RNF09441.1 eukaryotic peptide chain release factor subunit 1 [Trypanosoma rangeli]|eukprot:RNF09441.1 eukaryotic peptide chain release factor subunit 1 [Trypanosoma rangeli]
MRLLRKAVRPDGEVEVKVTVNTTEDLWHLYNLLLCGDHVRTKTRRKVTKETSIGTKAAETRVITLELEVRQVDFSPEELRVQGINVSENEHVKLGAHHTLSIITFPPQDITIVKKEWNDITEARLKEACSSEARSDTVAVIMDNGTANLLLVTPSFMYPKAKVEVTIAKKHKNDGTARDKSIQRFFKNVLDAICTHVDFEKIKVLLVCSPAHIREEFLKYMESATVHAEAGPLRTVYKNLSKVVLVKVTDCTNDGLRKAFADSTVASEMSSTRSAEDMKVWQSFHNTMSSDPDRCVYTPQMVYQAAMMGAIGRLMVSDDVFRSRSPVERRFYLSLVQFVNNSGGKASVFSSNHITGEQLTQLGSVAAILLFPCPELDEMAVVQDFINSEEAAAFIRENAPARVTV